MICVNCKQEAASLPNGSAWCVICGYGGPRFPATGTMISQEQISRARNRNAIIVPTRVSLQPSPAPVQMTSEQIDARAKAVVLAEILGRIEHDELYDGIAKKILDSTKGASLTHIQELNQRLKESSRAPLLLLSEWEWETGFKI